MSNLECNEILFTLMTSEQSFHILLVYILPYLNIWTLFKDESVDESAGLIIYFIFFLLLF